MVRMIDVANHAGVSLKTVSRVLNNEPHVQDALRHKVHASVKELGYIPSASARSLRSSRTYTFHLISRTVEGNFVNTVQSGALRASQKHGYNLMVSLMSFETLNNPESLSAWSQTFIAQKRPDGIILVPPYSDSVLFNDIINKAGIPISRIGPNEIDDINNVNIAIDDSVAAKEATNHLISLGHRRIGFIRGYEDHGATHKRYKGYCSALKDAGIDIDPALVKPGIFSFESGMNAGLELLALEDRPTGIFAANDDMAAGVIVAAYRSNIKVPEEVSVIGFDDSELAERIWPTLSTIRQPLFKYGEQAVEYLVNRAGNKTKNDNNQPSWTDILDYEFILRESTGPLHFDRS